MTETVGESHTASGGEMENRPRDPSSIPPATAVVDVTEKPAISYANLILQAISESPLQRLTLCDIYAWIKDRHPYYQYSSSGWQVRASGSLAYCFLVPFFFSLSLSLVLLLLLYSCLLNPLP